MNPVDMGQAVDVSLSLTNIQPQAPAMIDGFGNLIDKALNTNRIFQHAPLMMMERPQLNDRVFSNSADALPLTATGYLSAIDRTNVNIAVNDPLTQNMYVDGRVVPVSGSVPAEPLSELEQMQVSMQESMKMLSDMNQRSSLNNLMLTYAMANFTVLDTAVKSVSGAIDTLSRAQ